MEKKEEQPTDFEPAIFRFQAQCHTNELWELIKENLNPISTGGWCFSTPPLEKIYAIFL